MAKKVYNLNKAVLLRWARVIIPQVPALVTVLLKTKPEWTAELILVGSIITALDKYIRGLRK